MKEYTKEMYDSGVKVIAGMSIWHKGRARMIELSTERSICFVCDGEIISINKLDAMPIMTAKEIATEKAMQWKVCRMVNSVDKEVNATLKRTGRKEVDRLTIENIILHLQSKGHISNPTSHMINKFL